MSLPMQLKAIYRAIPIAFIDEQDTLVYNLKDGFAWMSTKDKANSWSTKNPTAVGAETEARKAGFDPLAIVYLKDLP